MAIDNQIPQKHTFNPFHINEMGLQFTNQCNLTCIHCGSNSGPSGIEGPSETWCIKFAEQIASNGFSKLMITGGEPMLRLESLLSLIEKAALSGISVELTSNGFWGEKFFHSKAIISQLSDAGLAVLTLSIDKIHSTKVPSQSYMNIAYSIREADFPFHLRIYGLQGEWQENDLIKDIVAICSGHCDTFSQPIFPVGRARKNANRLRLKGWEIQEEDNHPCQMVLYPFIDAELFWYLCSNAAVLGTNSPLRIGRLSNPEQQLDEMLTRHYNSLVFRALRAIGPLGMLEFIGFPSGVGENHFSICDICLHRLFSPNNFPVLHSLVMSEEFQQSLNEIEAAISRSGFSSV